MSSSTEIWPHDDGGVVVRFQGDEHWYPSIPDAMAAMAEIEQEDKPPRLTVARGGGYESLTYNNQDIGLGVEGAEKRGQAEVRDIKVRENRDRRREQARRIRFQDQALKMKLADWENDLRRRETLLEGANVRLADLLSVAGSKYKPPGWIPMVSEPEARRVYERGCSDIPSLPAWIYVQKEDKEAYRRWVAGVERAKAERRAIQSRIMRRSLPLGSLIVGGEP